MNEAPNLSCMKTIWIDIDNPPQVQYLVPLKTVLEGRGYRVIVTARDYGITFGLLKERGIQFHGVSKSSGKNRIKKIGGIIIRSLKLTWMFRRNKPQFVISSSRSSALAARILNIPAFIFCDYEYSNLTIYRICNSYIIFLAVIGGQFFLTRGFGVEQLIPFAGLKEHLTFAGIQINDFPAHKFPEIDSKKCVVLFRPPAEEAHYSSDKSTTLALIFFCFCQKKEMLS